MIPRPISFNSVLNSILLDSHLWVSQRTLQNWSRCYSRFKITSFIASSVSQWHKSVSDFTHIHVSKCWRQPWSPTIWSSDLKCDSWLFIVSQGLLCVSHPRSFWCWKRDSQNGASGDWGGMEVWWCLGCNVWLTLISAKSFQNEAIMWLTICRYRCWYCNID